MLVEGISTFAVVYSPVFYHVPLISRDSEQPLLVLESHLPFCSPKLKFREFKERKVA